MNVLDGLVLLLLGSSGRSRKIASQRATRNRLLWPTRLFVWNHKHESLKFPLPYLSGDGDYGIESVSLIRDSKKTGSLMAARITIDPPFLVRLSHSRSAGTTGRSVQGEHGTLI